MPRRTPTRLQASGHQTYQNKKYQFMQQSAINSKHYLFKKAFAVIIKVHLHGVHRARRLRPGRLC